MEFSEWLECEGLGKYEELLAANDIDDVEILADLNDAELEAIGIPIGSRKKIQKALAGQDTLSDSAPAVAPQESSPPQFEDQPVPDPEALPEQLAVAEHAYQQEVVHPVGEPIQAIQHPAIQQTTEEPPLFAPHASTPKTIRHQPKAKNSRKATAITIAIGVHVVLILLATTLTIFAASKDEPEIIASIAPPSTTPQQEMKKKTVQKQVKRAPSSASAAAAPMAQMMKANAEARFTAPDVTRTSTGPLGMGEGDLGSGAFGIGTGLDSGTGGGATFFGSKATGKRFLFILDISASNKGDQIALRNRELERSLSALKGVQYHVVLFGGPAFMAEEGWNLINSGLITGPGGKTYGFIKKTEQDFEFDGPDSGLPRARWRNATPTNTRTTIDYVKNMRTVAGTDWELAFRVGHYMEPPPDVIFFMSDGSGGNAPGPILALNKKRGSPVINTFAMQTSKGAQEFSRIAKESGGEFKIVTRDGKTIDGDDFLRNPGKYQSQLGR